MKEAQLEKVPVCCNATRRQHNINMQDHPQFTSTSVVNFKEIHNDRDAYLCPFLSVGKQTEAIMQRLSQHVSTKVDKSFMTPHSAGEPKSAANLLNPPSADFSTLHKSKAVSFDLKKRTT